MGNPSLWYETFNIPCKIPHFKDQSAILPTSTSRNSPTTKIFRLSASLASPTHIKNNKQILHLTFLSSSNHLMMTVPPRPLFYARLRDPFFVRMPSLSSSASHGVPRSAHFPIFPLSPPLHRQQHRPSRSRTTKLKFLRRPHPPLSATASSLHRCEAELASSHVRARSGVRALPHGVVPYPTVRRCGS